MKPFISIIVPCRNEGPWIGQVLDALRQQTWPQDRMEVLVVDNGSTDCSREVIKQYPVTLLSEPEPSAYKARNRAIQAARGEYLLFLDADTVPVKEWAEKLVAAVLENGFHLAGGRIESVVARRCLGSALLAYTRSAEERRKAVVEKGRLSGGNMLVARSAFDAHGLFSPALSGGDGEFSERANPDRSPVPYADGAIVQHQCDISSAGYLRRTHRIQRGQVTHGAPWFSRGMVRGLLMPGWRRAAEIRQTLHPAVRVSTVSLMLFLWMDRWVALFGRLAGLRDSRRADG